jgi:hypothetical protein
MHQLTTTDLNPAVLNVQYAVRGELAIKAEDLRNKLEAGEQLPFNRVINSNIGNPQQKGLDQPPITFIRQVSYCWCDWLLRCLPPTKCNATSHTGRVGLIIRLMSAMLPIGRGVDGIPPISGLGQGQVAQ